jgi:hypothetical protein
VQRADDLAIRARQHSTISPSGAAPVDADRPSRRAIAVQRLVHLARRQEEVGAAGVGHEEAEAVGMALHGAGDEVELRGEQSSPLRFCEHVAAAHELVDARGERLALALRRRRRRVREARRAAAARRRRAARRGFRCGRQRSRDRRAALLAGF